MQKIEYHIYVLMLKIFRNPLSQLHKRRKIFGHTKIAVNYLELINFSSAFLNI